MRELTHAEAQALELGQCPFCRGREWIEGPSGGLATNWYCANASCGAGFNVAPPIAGRFWPEASQVIREPKALPA